MLDTFTVPEGAQPAGRINRVPRLICSTASVNDQAAWRIAASRLSKGSARGRSSMVERQLPKLHTRVRFPSPAPTLSRNWTGGFVGSLQDLFIP
jgi:hypothetical protein